MLIMWIGLHFKGRSRPACLRDQLPSDCVGKQGCCHAQRRWCGASKTQMWYMWQGRWILWRIQMS